MKLKTKTQQQISKTMIRETIRNEFIKHKKAQFYHRVIIVCAMWAVGSLAIGFGFGFGVTVANRLISPVNTQNTNPQDNILSGINSEPVAIENKDNASESTIISYTRIVGKQYGKPFLGIVGEDLSEEDAYMYGLQQTGVYVRSVIQGAPADVYGITRSDIIIGFNDEPVYNIDSLIELIDECDVGDKPKIKIMRDKKNQIIIDILLSDYSENGLQYTE